MKNSYFIRVTTQDTAAFDLYLSDNHIIRTGSMAEVVGGIGTSLYSLMLTSEEELSIRLTFKLAGCMKFVKPFDFKQY